jgi:hypothetical protein
MLIFGELERVAAQAIDQFEGFTGIVMRQATEVMR